MFKEHSPNNQGLFFLLLFLHLVCCFSSTACPHVKGPNLENIVPRYSQTSEGGWGFWRSGAGVFKIGLIPLNVSSNPINLILTTLERTLSPVASHHAVSTHHFPFEHFTLLLHYTNTCDIIKVQSKGGVPYEF